MKHSIALFTLILFSIQAFPQQKFHLFETPDSLYSEVLGEQRMFWIQLPKFFDPSGKTRYPVTYLIDGDTQALALQAASFYYEGQYLPDMILVGISNTRNRVRDLTPSKLGEGHGWLSNQESGKADQFARFLEQELLPHIDSILPTLPYRTLVGHSYGGLFVINTMLKSPDLFKNFIAIDPSLKWDDQYLLKHTDELLQENDLSGVSLFTSLAAGSLHMKDESVTLENIMEDTSEYTLFARSILEFKALLNEHPESGIDHLQKIYPEDIHGSILLPSMIDGLKFVYSWYPLKEFYKFNDFETPVAELVELIDTRAQLLTANFGYPVPPFEEPLMNMLGYMSMEQGLMDRAEVFFLRNIVYFPHSANAHDSMADYYLANGETVKAIRYLRIALELSGDSAYQERIDELIEKIPER